ncbi:MAG: 3-hydroxyacyl-CoA dehydrogenase [Persicimonas sp.]
MGSGDIERVLVVGAGTMGQQIALQCAIHGYDVHLYDVAEASLEAANQQILQYIAQLRFGERLSREEAAASRERIATFSDAAEAAAGVDLISESIPEEPELKGEVFGQFDTLCAPHTLFTTNTSTLAPSDFAEATGRPAHFAALHFHPPVWYANVVDVMPHPGTASETMRRLEAFARSIGQIPLVLEKESPGYVFNAMLQPILDTALRLAADEVAPLEDIDRAWMGITKMPVGPFGMMDRIGIDLVHHITERNLGPMAKFPQGRKTLDFLQAYVDRGELGVKTGRGFYDYPRAAYQQTGFVDGDQE